MTDLAIYLLVGIGILVFCIGCTGLVLLWKDWKDGVANVPLW